MNNQVNKFTLFAGIDYERASRQGEVNDIGEVRCKNSHIGLQPDLSYQPYTQSPMKKAFLVVGIVSMLSSSIFAQTEEKDSRYSMETDILWPFFPGATRTHFLVKLWQKGDFRGDIYAGINIDFPQDRETEGRFADYSIASGYRQYFWKGLHLEFSQTTGLGVLKNHVTTAKTYNSFDWLITGYIGYRFDLAGKKLYVLPQFGVARVIYKSNPWPIYEDETLTKEVGESPFMLGSLRFGINL